MTRRPKQTAMRIVFFSHRFAPDIGGVERSVEALAGALVSRGHQVTIVTESDSCLMERESPGLTVLRMQVRRLHPFTFILRWSWIWRRRDVFRKAQALHFHDYSTFIGWFFPFRFLFPRLSYTMTFHGFDSWPPRFRDTFLRRLSAFCMHSTFAVGEYVQALYRQRVDHVNIGAPIRRSQGIPWRPSRDFIFIGRIESDTCIDGFAECLLSASEIVSVPSRLILVGDGALATRLTSMSGAFMKVEHYPATRHVDAYLNAAGYVIGAGFLTILDAFVFGRPVIAPALSSLRRAYYDSIPEAAEKMFFAANEKELADVLMSILRDPAQADAAQRIRNARLYAGSLSWEGLAEECVRCYGKRAA